MCHMVTNVCAKFHHDQLHIDKALGFRKSVSSNKKRKRGSVV